MFIKHIDKEADKTILTNEFGNKKELCSKHVGLCWRKVGKLREPRVVNPLQNEAAMLNEL